MKADHTTALIKVRIKKGQRLSQIPQIFPLPSNAIFHKILPGLGATYGEIIAPRHSIIVLPNRPVIEDKVRKHNKRASADRKILGIYKGISKDEIEEYLANDTITYKKILTTPEGYRDKLSPALTEVFDYVKRNFYLLIDECERCIQDVDYRKKITAPFDDFFDYDKKGLISATTLPFSDPRFEDFDHYAMRPLYNYMKPLALNITNNIVAAFKEYLLKAPEGPHFIFCTSIGAITALIDATGIREESKIHCSETRLTSLKKRQYKADSKFDKVKLAKYNFLTSRFYSGFDIELKYKPNVIMITEVVFAEHSILDPQTEVIQIVGRFRNGTKGITHITNFNPNIVTKNPSQVKDYLDGQQEVFKEILSLQKRLNAPGAQDALQEILTELKFTSYFNPDGSYNWFMFDNMIQEERVLGLYQSPDKLLAAYSEVKNHFKVTVFDKQYVLSDEDRLRRQSTQSKQQEIKEVVKDLCRLEQKNDHLVLGGETAYNQLVDAYPIIVNAFNIIGKEGIDKCDYKEPKIKRAVEEAIKHRQFYAPAVLIAVYTEVKPHRVHPKPFVITTLQEIFDRNSIKHRVTGKDIFRYFEGRESTRNTPDNKVYVLGKEKLTTF